MSLPRDHNGELIRFTYPGSYSVIYRTKDGGTLCASCANGEREEPVDDDVDDFLEAQWHLVAADVYWEGPDMFCDHCNKVMASEYGDPDDVTDTASKMIAP